MSDPMLDREFRRKLAVLRHADEVTGNVAMTLCVPKITSMQVEALIGIPRVNPRRRSRRAVIGSGTLRTSSCITATQPRLFDSCRRAQRIVW